jgi:hypothetical protein
MQRPILSLIISLPAGCRKRNDEWADVTTDGHVSLSNGTLQRQRSDQWRMPA